MTDQYRASLWDIYPESQICGIGENDTVMVDGCKGAVIQWSNFTTVTTFTRLTLVRQILLWIILLSPIMFVTGCSILSVSPVAGLLVLFVSLFFFQLPSPFYIWHLYGGKVWASEPCLFGIEGYVPIDVIEEKIFGYCLNRLSWSPNGSPLSLHREDGSCNERVWNQNLETAELLTTYPIKGIDPCNRGQETREQFRAMSESQMGEMKVSLPYSLRFFNANPEPFKSRYSPSSTPSL